ncbi:hypothetical protein PFISCL1PPCAC_14691 [Pristionchus fissidentatus]|uniref:Uncharacterized protein n=1 Tax=Pristionchus fissidentatus TaxID=1538716 RepID=A0AAV5W0C1_9BILA|nr:hypothetical protein PFISCL1PPCAC_14691 [Pristionchus fissidentatus]
MAAMAYQAYGSYSGSMRMPDQETPRRRRPQNTESALLSEAENQSLFAALGPSAVCLSAGVAELLRASGGKWTRALRGVIVMVKDYDRRAYFLRMVDIVTTQSLWEFQVYKGFETVFYPPHLLTFEGESDSHIYGLNFSSPKEAETFKIHLDNQEKKNGAARQEKSYRPPVAPVVPSTSSIPFVAPPSSIAASGGPRPIPGASPFNASGITVAYPNTTMTRETKSSGGTIFGKMKKNDKKKKIRKEDISNPTNFQHKAHVGWDQDTGFSNNADPDPMDETIKTILKAAGHDPSQMNKKTIKFVYDFIEKYQEVGPDGQIVNGGSALPPHHSSWGSSSSRPSPSISSPLPPPPPSRIGSQTPSIPPSRPPPPPPSSSRPLPSRPINGPPIPPPSIHTSPSAPPPPPPPPSSLPPIATSAPPPPPPPPPPVMGGPPPSGGPPPPTASSGPPRNNLLAEIQAGKTLKSVGDQMERKSNGDSRDDVMNQIRLGTTLKHVDANEKEKRKSSGVEGVGGLAGALARALEERRMNMGMDDDDDEDGDKDSENDWSD